MCQGPTGSGRLTYTWNIKEILGVIVRRRGSRLVGTGTGASRVRQWRVVAADWAAVSGMRGPLLGSVVASKDRAISPHRRSPLDSCSTGGPRGGEFSQRYDLWQPLGHLWPTIRFEWKAAASRGSMRVCAGGAAPTWRSGCWLDHPVRWQKAVMGTAPLGKRPRLLRVPTCLAE